MLIYRAIALLFRLRLKRGSSFILPPTVDTRRESMMRRWSGQWRVKQISPSHSHRLMFTNIAKSYDPCYPLVMTIPSEGISECLFQFRSKQKMDWTPPSKALRALTQGVGWCRDPPSMPEPSLARPPADWQLDGGEEEERTEDGGRRSQLVSVCSN